MINNGEKFIRELIVINPFDKPGRTPNNPRPSLSERISHIQEYGYISIQSRLRDQGITKTSYTLVNLDKIHKVAECENKRVFINTSDGKTIYVDKLTLDEIADIFFLIKGFNFKYVREKNKEGWKNIIYPFKNFWLHD